MSKYIIGALALLMAISFASSSFAIPLEAYASYTVFPGPSNDSDYQSANSGTITASRSYAAGTSAQGTASDTGSLAAMAQWASTGGSETYYALTGFAQREFTITNNTAGIVNYFFTFSIAPIILTLNDQSVSGADDLNAQCFVRIVNDSIGTILFETDLYLQGGRNSYSAISNGVSLGGSASETDGVISYITNLYEDTIDLGAFAPSESATFYYVVQADVYGDVSGDSIVGSSVFIGNPDNLFNDGRNAGFTAEITNDAAAGAIPEPATIGLISLGLAALALRRRRS